MRILFLDIDECAISFPCQNNGTCVNNYGSYVCECTEGYMGRHCKEGNPLLISCHLIMTIPEITSIHYIHNLSCLFASKQ